MSFGKYGMLGPGLGVLSGTYPNAQPFLLLKGLVNHPFFIAAIILQLPQNIYSIYSIWGSVRLPLRIQLFINLQLHHWAIDNPSFRWARFPRRPLSPSRKRRPKFPQKPGGEASRNSQFDASARQKSGGSGDSGLLPQAKFERARSSSKTSYIDAFSILQHEILEQSGSDFGFSTQMNVCFHLFRTVHMSQQSNCWIPGRCGMAHSNPD